MRYLLALFLFVSIAFADYPFGSLVGSSTRIKTISPSANTVWKGSSPLGAGDTLVWKIPAKCDYIGIKVTIDSIASQTHKVDTLSFAYVMLTDPTYLDSTTCNTGTGARSTTYGTPLKSLTVRTGTEAAPTVTAAYNWNALGNTQYVLYDSTGYGFGDYFAVIGKHRQADGTLADTSICRWEIIFGTK